jgi:hypothetical protein
MTKRPPPPNLSSIKAKFKADLIAGIFMDNEKALQYSQIICHPMANTQIQLIAQSYPLDDDREPVFGLTRKTFNEIKHKTGCTFDSEQINIIKNGSVVIHVFFNDPDVGAEDLKPLERKLLEKDPNLSFG